MTPQPFRSASILVWAHVRARRLAARARLALWRAEGARLHRDVHLFGRVTLIGDARYLRVGPGSALNEGVHLELRDSIWIGADVHVSSNVQLHTGELVPDIVPRVHRSAPIVIEDHAWIAAGAIVGAGVRIGRGSVVGAGAVVVDDVGPMTFVAGVPARLVRSLESSGDLPPDIGGDEVGRRRFRRGNGRPAAAGR
jgi:acetyltransferase-like isoleucine patch superfamily enzyme